jgi:hypothetical protein
LHLTISAIVAPSLLLRTPESTELGLRWAKRVHYTWRFLVSKWEALWTDPPYHPALNLVIVIFAVVPMILALGGSFAYFVLGPPFVRAGATMASAVRSPLVAFRNIPRNWWRFVACVDTRQQPEPLPHRR